MTEPFIHEKKREFQLERMILFSDAVFAIAITLLVIDIKVPQLPEPVSETNISYALLAIFPNMIGFVVSFFLIGLYWTKHHHLFGFVTGYTQKLIWLNLLFLFGIVLMPFSTSFYSQYIGNYLKTPVIFYCGNIFFIGIMNYFLWKYVTNKKNNLCTYLPPVLRSYHLFRALAVPVIFLLMALVYPYFPKLSLCIPPLTPLLLWVGSIQIRKKLKKEKLLQKQR